MPKRQYSPISVEELAKKMEKWENPHDMVEELGKDLKCRFDLENFEQSEDHYNKELKGLTGCVQLENDLTICGITSGGDWEHPVYFIVYWDGNKLRGYVPTDGNPWNTTTKKAYGNDDNADLKNAKKRWKEIFNDAEEVDSCDFSFDGKLIKADILARFEKKE